MCNKVSVFRIKLATVLAIKVVSFVKKYFTVEAKIGQFSSLDHSTLGAKALHAFQKHSCGQSE